MKLNDFSGGLVTRVDPTLLGANQAVRYANIDNAKGSLTSIKGYKNLNIELQRWFYRFKDKWYSSTNPREYVEYRNRLYWTENQNVPKKVVNGVEKTLGIAAPTAALVSVINNTGTITTTNTVVQYVYTYYDSSEGVESAPSPISTELALVPTKSVDLSNFKPSTNIWVDKIRLYRLGADTTDFTLLVELPIATTTYNDNIKTLNAIGSILDSYNNQPPQQNMRFLVEAYGIMFAALGDDLYYTVIGQPDAWPSLFSIPLPRDITGLHPIQDGLIIFTREKTWLLYGTTPETFKLLPFNAEHGCICHAAIQYIKNTLVWPSLDGICALNGSNVTVITKDKLDKITFDAVSATVFNEQYYLTLESGTVFVMDVRFEACYKTLEYPTVHIYNFGNFDNVLYGVINGNLVEVGAGEPIDLYYESPRITEGDASNTKLYNDVYVRANGRFIVDMLIDGVQVSSNELIGDKIFELSVPQEQQRGSDIQFLIQGTGVVKEIEYKIQGRVNGR